MTETGYTGNIKALIGWYETRGHPSAGEVKTLVRTAIAGNKQSEAILVLMLQAFEAGREFQHKNKSIKPGDGSVYIEPARTERI